MYNIFVFANNEAGAKEMAQYIINELQEKGLENYKISDDVFSTIFLAGSPGAGKTEWIESFLDKEKYVILDSDEYRKKFDGYKGSNAEEFQQYSSRVMDKMFSFCMKNNLNVIIDGTFGNKKIIEQNIGQCIKKKRVFMVVLVMQDPIISYLYTKKRELEKTRKVPVDAFLDKFFNSIDNTRFTLNTYRISIIITKKDPNAQKGQRYKNIFIKNIRDFDKETKIWYNNRDEICGLIKELDNSIEKFGYNFINRIANKIGLGQLLK